MAFVRFIGFAVVRAWQGFWRNAMMSLAATATVILMLVLLSGLFIVISGLNSGLAFIESKVAVTARLIDGLSDDQRDALIATSRRCRASSGSTYVEPRRWRCSGLQEAYAASAARNWTSVRREHQAVRQPGDRAGRSELLRMRWRLPSRTDTRSSGSPPSRPITRALLDIIGTIRMVGVVAWSWWELWCSS